MGDVGEVGAEVLVDGEVLEFLEVEVAQGLREVEVERDAMGEVLLG